MPRLAFSPTPNGGAILEKENDSFISCAAPGSISNTVSNGHVDNGGGMMKGSVTGRVPLENIGAGAGVEGVAAGAGAAGPVGVAAAVCKRNSSCTPSDCAMAASAFGIEELRQVNARHSASSRGCDDDEEVEPAVDGDSTGSDPVAPAPPATPVKASPAAAPTAPRSEAFHGNGGALVEVKGGVDTTGELAGAGHAETRAEEQAGTGVVDGSVAARFKAARAIFSPPKPRVGAAKSVALPRVVGRKSVMVVRGAAVAAGAELETPLDSGAGADEPDVAEADGDASETGRQEEQGIEETAAAAGEGEGANAPSTYSPPRVSVGSVLSSGSTGLPPSLTSPTAPLPSSGPSLAAPPSVEGAIKRGAKDSTRKPSGSRRSSRSDMFFECSSEVDRLSATDDNSEPDADMEWGSPGGSKGQSQVGGRACGDKHEACGEGAGGGLGAAPRKGSVGGGNVGAGHSVSSAGGDSVPSSPPSPSPSSSPSPSRLSSSMLGIVGILGGPSPAFPSSLAAISGSRARRSPRSVNGLMALAGAPRGGRSSESSRRESVDQEPEVALKAPEDQGDGVEVVPEPDVEKDRMASETTPERPPDDGVSDSLTAGADVPADENASKSDGDAGYAEADTAVQDPASGAALALVGAAVEASTGAEAAGEAARGPTGRRRNRRRVPEWELQLGAEAYEDDSSLARFSQGEVDAKIRERLAEQSVAFEKQVTELKAAHEAEMAALEAELKQSSKGGEEVIMEKDTEALEREISMLSERFGEAAAEARLKTEALSEKEALLGAVTAQLIGIQNELAAGRSAHASEMQSLTIELESERKRRLMVENNLQRIEEAYNRLEDDERQKRSAGILKMKKDMQALAQAQFNEANKKHNIVKARLAAAQEEVVQLREKTKTMEEQLGASNRQCDELRQQVEVLEGGHAESIVEASRREKLLLEELAAFRAAAAERKEELESMARERDAAKDQGLTSQNAMTRLAIRNKEMKAEIDDLSAKVTELEGFCTQALDELDQEKEINAALRAAVTKQPKAA